MNIQVVNFFPEAIAFYNNEDIDYKVIQAKTLLQQKIIKICIAIFSLGIIPLIIHIKNHNILKQKVIILSDSLNQLTEVKRKSLEKIALQLSKVKEENKSLKSTVSSKTKEAEHLKNKLLLQEDIQKKNTQDIKDLTKLACALEERLNEKTSQKTLKVKQLFTSYNQQMECMTKRYLHLGEKYKGQQEQLKSLHKTNARINETNKKTLERIKILQICLFSKNPMQMHKMQKGITSVQRKFREYKNKNACTIQSKFRAYKARSLFLRQKNAANHIQNFLKKTPTKIIASPRFSSLTTNGTLESKI